METPEKPGPHGDPWGNMPRCGALTRDDDPCKLPAGYGTDHVGQGRCKFHGGSSHIKHGRYSRIDRPRIAALMTELGADPDPFNLEPEVVLLRALVLDYIERYDTLTEALLDWHEDWKVNGVGSGKPRQVIDILAVSKFIAEIGSLVDKIHKQKQEGAISLAALDRVLEQMGVELVAAANEVITDAAARTKLLEEVERRWGSVQVEGKPGR